ncbi:MAG: alpha-hydroxy acid oxidase [Luteibacter sp.]|uniref:alpha-hydroxy acid oxidase n=1 Tax=Luteibacter sp. TaxID=1886636 RepID=UPI002807E3A3|nr:alpha-hydroxy acid oxidase [Luteibacter sp.]MDQ7995138.1 alpha-hydroxy acid oxidase [Luteibacter sp.]MDQ8051164.1 alpha-hydroxy acid oxidase [Luteibacter sp.]
MPTPITCVADLRDLARKRVPRAFFDYDDRGSYEEVTLRDNRAVFDRIHLRQRVMIDVDRRDLTTEVIGQPLSVPLAIAPTGLTGLTHGSGEILAARAAAAAGIPFCLSTMSICSVEQVAAAVKDPFWFQIYVMRDRGFTRSLITRAREAGCSALMVTADLQIQGQRHREIKNGMTVPPKLTMRNLVDILGKPRWVSGVLSAPSRSFGNLAGQIDGADGLTTLAQWIGNQFDPRLTWDDIGWIRDLWPGKLILKGIMEPDDARSAVKAGVDAIVVSNHGGRQLDGAVASAYALPRVVDAVGNDIEVLFDGGIQTGQALLKALALGARAGLIGKAFLYGLGAMGQEGVTRVIEILRRELDVSMALTGNTSVRALDRSILLDERGEPWLPLRPTA